MMKAVMLYKLLLAEKQCVRNRVDCDKQCKSCKFAVSLLELDQALNEVIEIVKARNPELYFVSTLEELNLLEGKENADRTPK